MNIMSSNCSIYSKETGEPIGVITNRTIEFICETSEVTDFSSAGELRYTRTNPRYKMTLEIELSGTIDVGEQTPDYELYGLYDFTNEKPKKKKKKEVKQIKKKEITNNLEGLEL